MGGGITQADKCMMPNGTDSVASKIGRSVVSFFLTTNSTITDASILSNTNYYDPLTGLVTIQYGVYSASKLIPAVNGVATIPAEYRPNSEVNLSGAIVANDDIANIHIETWKITTNGALATKFFISNTNFKLFSVTASYYI